MYIQACSKKTHRASWGLAGDGSSMSPYSVSVRQAVIEHNNKYIQTCSKIDPPGNKLNLPFLGGVMPPPLPQNKVDQYSASPLPASPLRILFSNWFADVRLNFVLGGRGGADGTPQEKEG